MNGQWDLHCDPTELTDITTLAAAGMEVSFQAAASLGPCPRRGKVMALKIQRAPVASSLDGVVGSWHEHLGLAIFSTRPHRVLLSSRPAP